MSTIRLHIPKKELQIFTLYAKYNHTTLSDIIRTTMMDRIEEEYYSHIFEEYEAEKASGTLVTHPIEELWDELNR